MPRRLAAVLMSLMLAAPVAAAAQDYGPRGWQGRAYAGPHGGGEAWPGQPGSIEDAWPGARRGSGPPPRDEWPHGRYQDEGRGPRPPLGPRGRALGLRRGQYLPPDARGAMIMDYERYHLRRPPRGYFWYRAGDDYVLAAVATGVIFEVIPADDF